MNADEMINKLKLKGPSIEEDPQYWLRMEHEVKDFLKSPDVAEDEKKKLKEYGWILLESMNMACRGIEYENEKIKNGERRFG